MACAAHQQLLHLLILASVTQLLKLLSAEVLCALKQLFWLEVAENVVLDLQKDRHQRPLESGVEALAQIVEGLEHALLGQRKYQLLVQVLLLEVRADLCLRRLILNSQHLLEKADDKFDHLFVLLVLALGLKAVCHVHD